MGVSRLVLKMATATPGKRAYKQDLPPKGGYAPFEYKRVPIRKLFNAPRLYMFFGTWTFLGFVYWSRVKRRREALGTENRSIELALQPMLSAAGPCLPQAHCQEPRLGGRSHERRTRMGSRHFL